MKKTFVLIVALLIKSSFTLLAQNNKTDTGIHLKDTAKVASATKKADTVATVKAQSKSPVEQTNTDKTTNKSALNDTTKLSAAKDNKVNPDLSSKKDTAKLADKRNKAAKKNAKVSVKKVKPKSEAEVLDSAMHAFQKALTTDTSIRDTVKHFRKAISLAKARPYPLVETNINNIRFYHRYWRDIDLQDPKNKKFATYHATLINALLNAIKQKEIKAYSPVGGTPDNPTGDAFTLIVPYTQLMAGLSDTAMVDEFDKDGNKIGSKAVPNPFTPEKIWGYRIKEDVYLDKNRTRVVTRIIGIAPLVKLTLSSGEIVSIQPLCWLKFRECRNVLVTLDIDPTKKIGDSMDDFFLQRRFYGRIVQESNAEGLRIKDYKTEIADQLTEANRIEKKLATYKKGTWVYTMLNVSKDTLRAVRRPVQKPKKAIKVKPPSVK